MIHRNFVTDYVMNYEWLRRMIDRCCRLTVVHGMPGPTQMWLQRSRSGLEQRSPSRWPCSGSRCRGYNGVPAADHGPTIPCGF